MTRDRDTPTNLNCENTEKCPVKRKGHQLWNVSAYQSRIFSAWLTIGPDLPDNVNKILDSCGFDTYIVAILSGIGGSGSITRESLGDSRVLAGAG